MVTHHWSEALVTPLLVAAIVLLSPLPRYVFRSLKLNGSGKGHDIGTSNTNASAFIVPAQIHHARMLPKESQHSFKYPSLYFAFELQALERGQCDCLPAFKWSGDHAKKGFALTKLHPKDFGRKVFADAETSKAAEIIDGSILLKLAYELRFRGYLSVGPQDVDSDALRSGSLLWEREMGKVWAIAMPTVFGLAGFNPLTVYYVYRPGSSKELWLAILEVHNTFNERHIYVCEVGKGEDEKTGTSPQGTMRKGYDHSWTFPRDFHVSPFNDRLGYYQLFLRDMWKDSVDGLPSIDIRLLLLVPPEEEEERQSDGKSLQKKLLATLTSSNATSATQKPTKEAKPMTASSVFSMLIRQPFDLFLPVARIMIEAAKLHWKKRLPVHIRPEPKGEAKRWNSIQAFDGIGCLKVHNPTESKDLSADAAQIREQASGNIYWNDESSMERICRKAVEKYLCNKSSDGELGPIQFRNRNAEQRDTKIENGQIRNIDKHDRSDGLTFYTMSSALFIDLCLYMPQQALLFGSKVEQGWGVNSTDKFDQIFASSEPSKSTRTVRLARWLRSSYLLWAIQESGNMDDKISHHLLAQSNATHFLDQFDYSWSLLFALAAHVYSLKLMASASRMLNVRYVRAPWAQIGEGIALLKQNQEKDTQI
ncbi:uncharacterized protein FA14DRAFT_53959 [Meira miltonrushii]|uniref:DUF1365-domain-containing protein n=1 Tax=Meira miltonrushii TaxID=1280837 RepID=A0A316VF98_9BASI|nr:uncharacterized protein FA14DRAFT_53959 [Meira miltonrushii]PWN36307.1 hypothetical protein FA14DRAFT_53959 [Meira miltonrushii]